MLPNLYQMVDSSEERETKSTNQANIPCLVEASRKKEGAETIKYLLLIPHSHLKRQLLNGRLFNNDTS